MTRRISAAIRRTLGRPSSLATLVPTSPSESPTKSEIFDFVTGVSPAVAAVQGELIFFVSTADTEIGRRTFVGGSVEDGYLGSTLRLVKDILGRDPLVGKVFLDVGANIGTACIPALRLHGASRAIAIEPDHRNLQLLRCNLIMNDVADLCETLMTAVSCEIGTGVLEIAGANFGDHRLRTGREKGPDLFVEGSREVTTVPVTTVDAVLHETATTPSDLGMVWIDTQGHEPYVLQGATALHHADVPVVIEFWPYGLRRSSSIERFFEEVEAGWSQVVDVRASGISGRPVTYRPGAYARLAEQFPGPQDHTDLLLFR